MTKIKFVKLSKKCIALCVAMIFCFSFLKISVHAADIDEETKDYTPHMYGVDIPNSGEPGAIGNSRVVADLILVHMICFQELGGIFITTIPKNTL